VPFFAALEAFAKALAELHRSLPDSLCKNLAMLRRSKAPKEIEYGCWLQGEVDVHKRHRFAHYAAESAWIGNLWLGRILEFFVEMFALLRTGEETGACCSLAFKKTLHQHMNIVQRKGFGWAIASVPARAKLLQLLAGAANVEDALRDLDMFVSLGQRVAKVCLQLNEALDSLRETRRREFLLAT